MGALELGPAGPQGAGLAQRAVEEVEDQREEDLDLERTKLELM